MEPIKTEQKTPNPIKSILTRKPFSWDDSRYTEARAIIKNKGQHTQRRVSEAYRFLEID